ncbi:hypothetical protein WJX72_009665 [[Myrmecia] bisecta]|uniref:Ribosome-binding factor A n=1 Tax=[Myrmecia] bisecta TaxID=41462 RepID=A0AAW1QAZ4_9CHLO
MPSGMQSLLLARLGAQTCCRGALAVGKHRCSLRPPHAALIAGATQGRQLQRKQGRRGLSMVCMAAPRRVARVAKQLGREVGNLLLTDQVLQQAVCPEKRVGMDSTLSAIASVSDVELSGDLQVAKVYISIYSDEQGKVTAMRGLSRLEGYVRKKIAGAMELRTVPEVRFIQDESIQRSEQVLALLDQIRAGTAHPPPIALPAMDDFDFDWDEEDDQAKSAASGSAPQSTDGFLNLDSARESNTGSDLDRDTEEDEDESDDEVPHAANAGPQISRSMVADGTDFLDFGEEEGPPVYMTAQPSGGRRKPRAQSSGKRAAGKAAGKRRLSKR